MSIKPWREIAIPHQDVLKGTFQQSEFAADLSVVHSGTASLEYGDPTLFYARTFITEGMRLLLDSVVRRLNGNGGDPVIQLQTAFGGGKTHTMLAVYHLASGEVPISQLHGLAPIIDATGVMEVPKAKVVVLDGNNLSPNQPNSHEDILINTMWGELAWQLGQRDAYDLVKESDVSGTSPGKGVLIELLSRYSPCVILVDELVAYLRQFEEGRSYSGGTFDSNLSFIQALTEALKAVPQAILLASLPESEAEVGGVRGQQALDALEKYFGRVQAIWKPVATEEAFEIVRRRLFATITDTRSLEESCRAYADIYIQNNGDFPIETQESHYLYRLEQSYPIHPEVFDRLYEDWSSLDKFQRTRGVLKLMAKVIHKLWTEGNTGSMILPSDIPLYDPDVRNELVSYLPQGWDPVLERDVDGLRAETVNIDRDSRFGAYQASRRTARTIFLGSAPSGLLQTQRGIGLERILLGCVQPGQTIGVYKDVVRRMIDRLHYLNTVNNRYYYDTRPNLRREMEERKKRFTDLDNDIRLRISKWIKSSEQFKGVHIFTPSADVPDDEELRLVILPTNASYSRSQHNQAEVFANEVLTKRGTLPRVNQNRLLFLAPDYEAMQRLRESVRSVLSWQSIVTDIKDARLNLDTIQQKQAKQQFERAEEIVVRILRETYKWLLIPFQEASNGKGVSTVMWESISIQANNVDTVQEIVNKLKENELLISSWAPIHLNTMLKTWFWKDEIHHVSALEVWKSFCQYLFLPRLLNRDVFQTTIEVGMQSADFFGIAYTENEGKYEGFSFGKIGNVIMDGSLLLINPSIAITYEEERKKRISDEINEKPNSQYTVDTGRNYDSGKEMGYEITNPNESKDSSSVSTVNAKSMKKRFYGKINLSSTTAKIEFSEIYDEILSHFVQKHDTNVVISVEIEASSTGGFDDNFQRIIKENGGQLNFHTTEFEED